MITKTIGIGGDFADIGLAWIWLATQSPFSDDYTFRIISDFTETTFATDGFARPQFNGHSLSIINNNKHIITVNNNQGFYRFICNPIVALGIPIFGDMLFDGLIFHLPVYNDSFIFLSYSIGAYTAITMPTSTYKDCIFIGQGTADVPTAAMGQGALDSTPMNLKILNCIVYRMGSGIVWQDCQQNARSYIENTVIYKCKYGISAYNLSATPNDITTMRNICIFDSITKDISFTYMINPNNVITNCADSDNSISTSGAILSGNITGITTAAFLSINPIDNNFLKIDQTSPLFETGTTSISSWNNHDLTGNPRPDDKLAVSIGSYEYTTLNNSIDITNSINTTFGDSYITPGTTIQQVSYGMDDGVTVAISGGKLGFYGLAAPIVKQTLSVGATITAASTTTACNNAVAECYAALAALGLVA